MNTDELKKVITKNIKANGRGEITGPVLQSVLVEMVNGLQTDGLGFLGIINPGDPAPSNEKVNGYYLSFAVNNPKYPESKKWIGISSNTVPPYFNGATLNRYCMFIWTQDENGSWQFERIKYEDHTRKVYVVGRALPIRPNGLGGYTMKFDTNNIRGYLIKEGIYIRGNHAWGEQIDTKNPVYKVFVPTTNKRINWDSDDAVIGYVSENLFDAPRIVDNIASPYYKSAIEGGFIWSPPIIPSSHMSILTRKKTSNKYKFSDSLGDRDFGSWDKKGKVKIASIDLERMNTESLIKIKKTGYLFRYRRYHITQGTKKPRGLSASFVEYKPFIMGPYGRILTPLIGVGGGKKIGEHLQGRHL